MGTCDCPGLEEGLDPGQQTAHAYQTLPTGVTAGSPWPHRPAFLKELALKIRHSILFAHETAAQMLLESLLKASRASTNAGPY